MDYQAILNMYQVDCASCGVEFNLTWHEYQYRTDDEICTKCKCELHHVESIN